MQCTYYISVHLHIRMYNVSRCRPKRTQMLLQILSVKWLEGKGRGPGRGSSHVKSTNSQHTVGSRQQFVSLCWHVLSFCPS